VHKPVRLHAGLSEACVFINTTRRLRFIGTGETSHAPSVVMLRHLLQNFLALCLLFYPLIVVFVDALEFLIQVSLM
jgi:hypothetical protein